MTDSTLIDKRHPRPALRVTLPAILLALLAACATPPPVIDDAEVQRRLAEAYEHIAEDRPLAAVRIYRELAAEAPPEDVQRWRLQIVEVLFDHQYPELALEFYSHLDAEPIPPELALRKRVTDAQAAVARRQGVRALQLLPDVDLMAADSLNARILATRAEAHALTGQPERALAEYVQREPFLDTDEAIDGNHDRIWSLLSSVEPEGLEGIATQADTRAERGWAELALAMERVRTGHQRIGEALDQWERRYIRHPAIDRFLAAVRERVIAELTYPERVDVLLPLSGRLAEPAAAIRDGMLATYYNLPGYIRRPELVIHDIGDDGVPVDEAYDLAVRAGSGFVIGPLDRDNVARLSRRRNLPVPVLTLNYLPGDASRPASDFYQFGLSPEDEAREAAEAAIRNHKFNAVAMVPAGEWGTRLLSAFRERFEELGGVVLESVSYDGSATDYGHPIQAMLNIDDSYARHRMLRRSLGEELRFEPRRRDDAEVIFLAALPRQARIATPQLKFHRIGATPVYATSNVFAGRPDSESDWDMNDLFFTETPWILNLLEDNPDPLQRMVIEQWPGAHQRYPRLFALGADALEILPRLRELDRRGGDGPMMHTGRLSLAPDGRLRRQLLWAQFVRGVPERVDEPIVEEVDDPLGAEIRERAGQEPDPDPELD